MTTQTASLIPFSQSRTERRDIEGFGPVRFFVPVLTANASTTYMIEDRNPEWKKYLPFDHTIITNNGADAIDFYPNQSPTLVKRVIGTGSQSFGSNVPMWGWKITNLTANSIAANVIEVACERTGAEADNFDKKVAGSRIGKFLLGL